MFWLIRAAAYALGGLVIWNTVQGVELAAGRRLVLDPDNALVFGVCAGLSNYTGFDVTLIRLLWALLTCWRGIGFYLYVLAFLLMP